MIPNTSSISCSGDSRLEQRRRRLTRGYQIATQYRVTTLGFSRREPAWERLSCWVERQFLPHYFGLPPKWRLYARLAGGRRTLPDFCVVGPPKAGTSDLAVSLMLHPHVMTPLAKEFWNPDPAAWRIFYPTEREKRRHAALHGGALSPYFVPALHWMEMARNLAQVVPNAKIVLTLRNPEDRVFSQWKWEIFVAGKRRSSRIPCLSSFSAYVDTMLEGYPDHPVYVACDFAPLQTSIYWRSVQFWMGLFGRENVLVLDIGEYFRDRNRTLLAIQQFLGLPHLSTPAFQDHVN